MKTDALKKIRAVFFDLDGTLLQVEMKEFIPAYIGSLAACFADLADPRRFSDVLLSATFALLRPRSTGTAGGETNEALFLRAVQRRLGIAPDLFSARLARFCGENLHELASHIHPLPLAREIVQWCFRRNLSVVIATNPVFPRPVVEARLAWGNLHDFPYAHVTTFENSRFCKPDPQYFHDLLVTFGLEPQECLMVGNDTEHDLAAREAGIATFLVDTWLVDRRDGDFTTDFRGGHPELLALVRTLGAEQTHA